MTVGAGGGMTGGTYAATSPANAWVDINLSCVPVREASCRTAHTVTFPPALCGNVSLGFSLVFTSFPSI